MRQVNSNPVQVLMVLLSELITENILKYCIENDYD